MIKEFESRSLNGRRNLKNEDIYAIIFNGFWMMGQRNLPIPETVLYEKEKEIAENVGKTDFKSSSGCLMSFHNQHNYAEEICEESKDVPEYNVWEW